MSRLLTFDRLARRLLKQPRRPLVTDVSLAGIDVDALALELSRYDASVRERLRLAALRAIDEELATIRAEQQCTP